MTLDEYGVFKRAENDPVWRIDGTWWRMVRPFFYQPLFPLQEIAPSYARPPLTSLVGGFQHLVPEGAFSNSVRRFFVFDNGPSYCLGSNKQGKRYNIRKGTRHFSIRLIDDLDEFVSSGHEAYLSFCERTGYSYKRERRAMPHFRKWAEILFRFPKVKILGAYCNGALAAVSVSYLVKGVLIHATAFSRTEHLKLYPADLLCHSLRERAARCPEIRLILEGGVTGIKNLDDSKLQRGCRIMARPAFFRVNPLAETLLKRWMPEQHRKLRGTEY